MITETERSLDAEVQQMHTLDRSATHPSLHDSYGLDRVLSATGMVLVRVAMQAMAKQLNLGGV